MKGVADRTVELMNEYQSQMDRVSWQSFQHFLVVKIETLEDDIKKIEINTDAYADENEALRNGIRHWLGEYVSTDNEGKVHVLDDDLGIDILMDLLTAKLELTKSNLKVCDGWVKEYHEENEALRDGIKSAHLHLLASVCECGEPLKETDAFDVLDALLKESE